MNYSLFYAHWKLVVNGFYTVEEKARIFRLLATASGEDKENTEKMLEALEDISENDAVGTQNRMLIARFSENVSEYYYAAVKTLSNFYAANKSEMWFGGRAQWARHILSSASDTEKGFFRYAAGNVTEAISSFKRAVSKNEDQWPLYEILAVLYYEQSDYEEALNYAAKALWIDGQKLDIPTVDRIAEEAMRKLEINDAEYLKNKADYSFGERKIGF